MRNRHRAPTGFTLLEVILSLTLATFVLLLIGIAIDAHITISERSRAKIEQAQLARSVFRMIGDDLRNAILYAPLDFSSIANLNLDADIGGGTEDAGSMGGDTNGMGGGQNGQGGNTPGGATPGGNVPGGQPPTGQQSGGNQSSSGNQPSGGANNTSGGSNTGGASGGSTDTGSVLDEAAGPTEDPPGVYGSAYEINVDISRLPRVDEYDAMMQNGEGAIADIPSDVKTVAYYVTDDASGGTSPGGPLSSDAQGGLVRRAVDRAVTQYAFNAGSTAALDDSAAVLAPEVTDIAFEYFDGSTWSDTWDMVEKGAPPVAVRITIAIAAPKIESIFDRTVGALGGSASDEGESTEYTQVVYLPAAEGAASSSGGSSTGSTAETGGAASAEAAP
ncbi:MAG: hypothetical protein DCC68_10015 [Planctomycetota bacterium]|nr:MAG: hypothetical protein DCC68_10015 [Planctomycetota bacterium]